MIIHELKTPILDESIEKIRIGEYLNINGEIILARDEAHKRALEYFSEKKKLPVDFSGAVVYHAGPVAISDNGVWNIVAVGPTTSARMELFEPELLRNFNVKIILGKGGMGTETVNAIKKHKALYGALTGGTSLIWAKKIVKVVQVDWLDLGIPEALWKLQVKDFGPILVAIDSFGNSIYDEVNKKVLNHKQSVLRNMELIK